MTAWCCDWCGKRNAQAADTCQQCGRDITRPPMWRCHLCARTTPAHQRACRALPPNPPAGHTPTARRRQSKEQLE